MMFDISQPAPTAESLACEARRIAAERRGPTWYTLLAAACATLGLLSIAVSAMRGSHVALTALLVAAVVGAVVKWLVPVALVALGALKLATSSLAPMVVLITAAAAAAVALLAAGAVSPVLLVGGVVVATGAVAGQVLCVARWDDLHGQLEALGMSEPADCAPVAAWCEEDSAVAAYNRQVVAHGRSLTIGELEAMRAWRSSAAARRERAQHEEAQRLPASS